MAGRHVKIESMRAVRRMVLRRLLAVAVAVSLVAVALVIAIESSRIKEETLSRAVYGATLLNVAAMNLLDRPIPEPIEYEKFLQNALVHSRNDETGRLVYAGVYDMAGNSIAAVQVNSEKASVQPEIARLKRAELIGITQPAHHLVWIKGKPYLDFIAPLRNSAGAQLATMRTLIEIAPESLATMWRRARRSVLAAILIVFTVSAVLYPIITRLVRRIWGVTDDLLRSNLGTLEVLGSAIAKRDSDTDSHNYRATIYSVRLAEALGLGHERIRELIKGALLHDVGKIGVRDNILLKPEPLTPEEYVEMKRHVRYGVEIISRSEWLKEAADVVGCHHEKYDGSGYDQALSGESIPEAARVFSIADVFDALTSRRPYKAMLALDESLEILRRGRGTHFDPAMLDAFLKIAPVIHEQATRRSDEETRRELQEVLDHYYKEGVGTLV